MITRTPLVDDDGSGETGSILNNAWLQNLYNAIDAEHTAPIAVPFSAANYSGNLGAWTVAADFQDVLRYQVLRADRLVLVAFSLNSTVVSLATACNALLLAIPGVPVAAGEWAAPFSYYTPEGPGTGKVSIAHGETRLVFWRDIAATPFGAQANQFMYLQGAIAYGY